jgi:hypothetical protein
MSAAVASPTPSSQERWPADAAQNGIWQPTAKNLQTLLGRKRLLRDFAPFTTERGEPAALLLYAAHARRRSLIDECFGQGVCAGPEWEGLVWLDGDYAVGLVIDGRFVNGVPIDIGSTPLLKAREPWPLGGPDRHRRLRSDELEPIKLIELADYNGDFDAWEFRLVRHESFSNFETMLAGYSARQRKAVVYPIISGNSRAYWHDDLFPDAAHAEDMSMNGGRIRYLAFCGERGNSRQVVEEFAYDRNQEAWVLKRNEARDCGAVGGVPWAGYRPDVLLQMRHADRPQPPGALASVDVIFNTRRADVAVVMMDLMVDPQLTILQDAEGRPSCRAAARQSDVVFWFDPPRCVSGKPEAACQPAMEIGASIPVAPAAGRDALLFRCDVRVGFQALPGGYPIWATKVRVYAKDGAALSATNDVSDFLTVSGVH